MASHCGLRPALLIGGVLLALALIGMPDKALACAPLDQTITTAVTGPVISNGGGITVDSTASITAGAQGVYAQNCLITVLGNSGLIAGGAGGTGVSNAETIMTLYNTGAIKGGAGGLGFTAGASVSNAGTIAMLSNGGAIEGGLRRRRISWESARVPVRAC